MNSRSQCSFATWQPRCDLQIVSSGTAANNLEIVLKQLRTAKCPNWHELADMLERLASIIYMCSRSVRLCAGWDFAETHATYNCVEIVLLDCVICDCINAV